MSGVTFWIVARAAYPGVVVSALLSAELLRARGLSPGLVVSLTFLATLAVVAVLERLAPRERAWNPPAREAAQDGVYLAIAAGLQPVGRLLGHALATGAALALSSDGRSRLPLAVQVVVALALADLGKYWLHRLAHERAWLFWFHAEHHAPTRMYSLNGVRLHPVNLLWNLGIDAAVPLLLGLEPRAVVLVAALRGAVAVLQHANVRLVLGPLNWVFSTPDLHAFHHSTAMAEANSNYGSTLVLWDVVFGTRRLPGGAPAALGLADGAPHPPELSAQLLYPLCRDRLDRCALRGRARR